MGRRILAIILLVLAVSIVVITPVLAFTPVGAHLLNGFANATPTPTPWPTPVPLRLRPHHRQNLSLQLRAHFLSFTPKPPICLTPTLCIRWMTFMARSRSPWQVLPRL